MERNVNITVSWMEYYELYFATPKLHPTDVDAGLYFWKEPGNRKAGREHIWLEVMSHDCVDHQLEFDLALETEEQMVKPMGLLDHDPWIPFWLECLANDERFFILCGDPRFPRSNTCRHIVPHWFAYTPAANIDVAELHATATEFLKTACGMNETKLHHEEFPTDHEIRAAEWRVLADLQRPMR